MKASPRLLLSSALATLAVSVGYGAAASRPSSAADDADASQRIFIARPDPDTPLPTVRNRALSDDIASNLAASLPTFSEAVARNTPDPTLAAPTEETGPLPENLQDDVVPLPRVVIRAPAPPVFKESELYTDEELSRIALRRYAGLNVTPFDFLNRLNAPIALQMYREDERLRVMSEMEAKAAAFERAGDAESGQYIRDQTNATFMRKPEWSIPSR